MHKTISQQALGLIIDQICQNVRTSQLADKTAVAQSRRMKQYTAGISDVATTQNNYNPSFFTYNFLVSKLFIWTKINPNLFWKMKPLKLNQSFAIWWTNNGTAHV